MRIAEEIAACFHESYERQAPDHGYETREASARPWADVPENNRALMTAVVQDLLDRGVIQVGALGEGWLSAAVNGGHRDPDRGA